jgi:hypothetical protein
MSITHVCKIVKIYIFKRLKLGASNRHSGSMMWLRKDWRKDKKTMSIILLTFIFIKHYYVAGFRRFTHYLELDVDRKVAYQPKRQRSIFCNSCSRGDI